MRPHGEIRRALFDAVGAGPGTTRELAQRAQVGIGAARSTLDNMRRSQAVCVIELARVDGVKRPVPVYGLPPVPATAQLANDLAACWAEFV